MKGFLEYRTPEIDPVTGEIVMISRGVFFNAPRPKMTTSYFRLSDNDRLLCMIRQNCGEHKSIRQRITDRIILINEAKARCTERMRYDMAEIWRNHADYLIAERTKFHD
jgi:hypothetical protein